MSHRKRRNDERKIAAQIKVVRRQNKFAKPLREIIRFNTQFAMAAVGGFLVIEALLPWTSSIADRAVFLLSGIAWIVAYAWYKHRPNA